MYSKILVVMLLAMAAAGGLLTLRQRRIEISHDVAVLHDQIHESRYALWDVQTSIAEQMNPQSMQASIVRAQLELEPIVPSPRRDAGTTRLAAGADQRLWPKSASP